MNFTRSIRGSNEFRVMNSPDDLNHVRIGDWKLVPGLVLVAEGANYDVRDREGGRYIETLREKPVLFTNLYPIQTGYIH